MSTRQINIALMVSLFAVPGVDAAEFSCAGSDVACLRDAINMANENMDEDTITLAEGGIYTLVMPDPTNSSAGPTGLPSISSAITINGRGATIQRDTTGSAPDFRILRVISGGSLRLEDVVVRRGRAVGFVSPSQDCGGIRLERGGTLIINKSVISDNFSTFIGGGICAAPGSVLVITESKIVNNMATDGGGIFNATEFHVFDSAISGNSASFGGGVFNDNGGVAYISGSVVSNNTAAGWGGGVGNISFGSAPDFGTRLHMSESVVSGNSADDGGGIFSNIGVVDISESVISKNDTNFAGSGVSNYRSVFSINSSCIIDNENVGVFNHVGAPKMDAVGNWWGAPSGPSGVGPGTGNAVSSNVDFVPFLISAAPICAVAVVAIDIKPGSDRNSINPRSNGNIPVAILTNDTFDALQVDPASVRFGPNQAHAVHAQGHIADVDNDGDVDLLLHFPIRQTGIAPGDDEVTLTGNTYDGQAIKGIDAIVTVGGGRR